jgi:RNA polymerase sigma-70 factor, ECF subfamily
VAAFEQLYLTLTPTLARYARVLTRSEAVDLVIGQSWTHIITELRTAPRGWDAFYVWALATTRHHSDRLLLWPALAYLPRRATRSDGTGAPVAAETITTRAAVERIAALPRPLAESLYLYAVAGLLIADVARITGMRRSAALEAAHQGAGMLADSLAASGSSDAAHATPA